MATPQERRITGIVEPIVTDLGYELILVRIIGSKKLQTLQIVAEDPKTGLLDLDGCTKISHALSAVMDVEDPISGAYQLEVSSPGMDRPLVRAKDFEKHIGHEISLETEEPSAEGQKNFRGRLTSFQNSEITLTTETGDVVVHLDNINKAKIVLTDELFRSVLKKRSAEKK